MSKSSIEVAKSVITTEIASLEKMLSQISDSFSLATELIHKSSQNDARVIITGMGKSGLIAQKIAATLSSTGTPSLYLHPADASHGDLGVIRPFDVVVVLSHSGESSEILQLIPFFKENHNPLIAICGHENSTLARTSDYFLFSAITKEACAHNIAPTSSTTSMLVLGDALAMALMEKNKFTPKDFARFHPKGSLGKRLLTSVKDVMAHKVPIVSDNANLLEVIQLMSLGRLGAILIQDQSKNITGIITDGDLRRSLENHQRSCFDLIAKEIATKNPISVSPETNLEDAKDLMNKKQITCLVVKENDQVIGIVQIFSCEI